MEPKEKILEFVESLISEGEAVKASKWHPGGNWLGGPPSYVDLQRFKRWTASCRVLLPMLGPFADSWREALEPERANKYEHALAILGTLEAIRDNLRAERLVRLSHLVAAEVFADLHSQAEHLLEQKYFLAAGVLFRAVLEEKVRRLASDAGAMPAKSRPTIGDLNVALYKAQLYDKPTMKHVEAMAAIGNDAAHVAQTLTGEDVERLGRDVAAFLSKFGA